VTIGFIGTIGNLPTCYTQSGDLARDLYVKQVRCFPMDPMSPMIQDESFHPVIAILSTSMVGSQDGENSPRDPKAECDQQQQQIRLPHAFLAGIDRPLRAGLEMRSILPATPGYFIPAPDTRLLDVAVKVS
jgi:hypothetical protein